MVEGSGDASTRRASDGDGDGGEAGRGCSGARGCYDRRLGLAEQPLDGLAVRFVAQFAGQLEYPGRANDRHTDSPPAPVDFAMTVLGGRLLHRESAVSWRQLSMRVDYGAVGDRVSCSIRS